MSDCCDILTAKNDEITRLTLERDALVKEINAWNALLNLRELRWCDGKFRDIVNAANAVDELNIKGVER